MGIYPAYSENGYGYRFLALMRFALDCLKQALGLWINPTSVRLSSSAGKPLDSLHVAIVRGVKFFWARQDRFT